jgi:8-amino-7-oxononanoate synthase
MALNTNLMATAKGDVMICDRDLHASLVDGALRSVARVMRFRHNDLDHFERCLNNCASEEKILVVSEGVFSMEGDLAELHGLVNLSKSNAARIYVDEAHGLGMLGRTERSRGSGRSWITGHSPET